MSLGHLLAGAVPENLRLRDARLLTAAAWCQSLWGAASRQRRDRVHRATAVAPGGPASRRVSSVESSLALLRATFPGETSVSRRQTPTGPPELSKARTHRGAPRLPCGRHALYFGEKPVEADSWLEEPQRLQPPQGNGTSPGGARLSLAGRSRDRGLIDQQTRLADQAAEIARQHGLGEINSEIHVAVGMSLVARGRANEAWPELLAGVAGLRNFGDPAYLVYALVQQATAREVRTA